VGTATIGALVGGGGIVVADVEGGAVVSGTVVLGGGAVVPVEVVGAGRVVGAGEVGGAVVDVVGGAVVLGAAAWGTLNSATRWVASRTSRVWMARGPAMPAVTAEESPSANRARTVSNANSAAAVFLAFDMVSRLGVDPHIDYRLLSLPCPWAIQLS